MRSRRLMSTSASNWLAFGSLDYMAGQVVGKLWMTAAAIVLFLAWRKWRSR